MLMRSRPFYRATLLLPLFAAVPVACTVDVGGDAPRAGSIAGAGVDSCIQAAQRAGYAYAGLQNGGQCWAGNTVGWAPLYEASCNMPCSANTGETCGAYFANSIWAVP